eukprot:GHRR01014025.1.p1 GENE.GHRR01014025.1~~GHRR01014025.1.p1  ORF type:complete len:351 (+),score=133.40 GHRR01014025.1:659-1711(+)
MCPFPIPAGMGAQKDMGLDHYAAAFAAGGLAAFVFDYRCFGGSDGEPRHWASPSRHVEDWHAAVQHVKSTLADRVNTSRLCLWGTSFAGGHVLMVACTTPGITAVISQVPHLDARAATKISIRKRGIARSLQSLFLGFMDHICSTLGLSPIYLPLVGPAGSLAFMQLNEFETKEYFSKHPPVYQGGWQNLARASLVWELFIHKYSPIKAVPDITCPIMFVAATEDVLCPVDQVYKAVKLAKRGQLLSRECTHFELYRGKLFEDLVAKQVEFFRQQTGLAAAAAAPGGKAGAQQNNRAAEADAAAAGAEAAQDKSVVQKTAAASGIKAPATMQEQLATVGDLLTAKDQDKL